MSNPAGRGGGVARVDKATGRLMEPVKLQVRGLTLTISPPSHSDLKRGKRSHRIYWNDGSGPRTTYKGVTFDEANAAAALIVARIQAGADRAEQSVGDMIDHYLKPGRRHARGKAWAGKTQESADWRFATYITPVIGKLVCEDLGPADLRRVIEQTVLTKRKAGRATRRPLTADTQARLRGDLRSLIKDGYEAGFIVRPPEEVLRGLKSAGQAKTTRAVEQDEDEGGKLRRVMADQLPTHQQVADLAHQFKNRYRAEWWRELEVYVAAYAGPRIGELLALRKEDVTVKDRRRIKIVRQLVEIQGSKASYGLPKWNKKRETTFPAVTPPTTHHPDGYPLGKMLAKRLRELKPDELLFPAPRGGSDRRNNFYNRRFIPSALAAGWPVVPEGERKEGTLNQQEWPFHTLRHVFCAYYLWDLKKDMKAVSDAAGHGSVTITLALYGAKGDRLAALD